MILSDGALHYVQQLRCFFWGDAVLMVLQIAD